MLKEETFIPSLHCYLVMLCISAACAVERCLSVVFVHCVETAKDMDIIYMESE